MYLMKKIPDIGETEFHHFGLLNMILGGFFGSRLMQQIREEKGLTYGIGSYIMQTPEGNAWCISGDMNSNNAELALDETLNILKSLIDRPPKDQELERAKRYYTGQLRSGFDGAFAMAEKLKALESRGYSLNHFDKAMDCIWNCTTEDLCLLADNYLRPETFKSVLAGDIK
jgi:predicted Zn-dependent peptidase